MSLIPSFGNLGHGGWLALILGVATVLLGPFLGGILGVTIRFFDRRTDSPVMNERVNAGSDKFFEWKKKLDQQAPVNRGYLPLDETLPKGVPDELELVHELWRTHSKPPGPDALENPKAPKEPQ